MKMIKVTISLIKIGTTEPVPYSLLIAQKTNSEFVAHIFDDEFRFVDSLLNPELNDLYTQTNKYIKTKIGDIENAIIIPDDEIFFGMINNLLNN